MGTLDKIKLGSSYYEETVWPGSDTVILLRVLNMHDYNNVFSETDKLFKDVTINIANMDDYNSERENFMLFYSITDPETKRQVFSNITDFRKHITPEIRDILAEELDAIHIKYSPDPYNVSDSEFDKILFGLKKNAVRTVGSVSNIYTLRKLVLYLVDHPPK